MVSCCAGAELQVRQTVPERNDEEILLRRALSDEVGPVTHVPTSSRRNSQEHEPGTAARTGTKTWNAEPARRGTPLKGVPYRRPHPARIAFTSTAILPWGACLQHQLMTFGNLIERVGVRETRIDTPVSHQPRDLDRLIVVRR